MPVCTEKSDSAISVMKAAKDGADVIFGKDR
jgi:hypothetical protein